MEAQPENSSLNFIRYPRFKELHKEIERCQRLSKASLEPQCMSLEGVPGTGKTTLVTDYVNMFPRRQTDNEVFIPVFYAEIPSPASLKGTVFAMLKRLGDPGGVGKSSIWEITDRLVSLIKACHVELVILDEFSNLIDKETNHVMNNLSDWLKMLIKDTGVPFLVMGMDGKVGRILQANDQLGRLFACREKLLPFAWETKSNKEEFAMFVQYAEKAIGLPLYTGNVRKTDLIYRIHYSTNGVVGNVMNLLRYSASIAIENNRDQIELKDLQIGFDKRLQEFMRNKENPFLLDGSESFSAPPVKTPSTSTGNDIGKTLSAR